MAPDLLFRAGVPHEEWMNLFLGHIWVHYIPGGNASWLAIALAASGPTPAVWLPGSGRGHWRQRRVSDQASSRAAWP